MTKYTEVTVQENGKTRKESRTVMNAPDLDGDELQDWLRKEWARHYPGQTYSEIRVLGVDEPKPTPPAGAFPAEVAVPAPQ